MNDLIVIGAGIGGYVAAIRAAQLGMQVTIVERDAVGGVCLNWGCIPSKALLRNAEVVDLIRHAGDFGIRVGEVAADFGAAIDRSRSVVGRLLQGVNGLLRSHGIEVISDTGSLTGPGEVWLAARQTTLRARNVLIATGARPRLLPGVPIVPGRIITSRQALEERDVPETAAIIGGGAVGCEFASIWRAYGSDVTIIDVAPQLLPMEDSAVSEVLEARFRASGVRLQLQTTVQSVVVNRDHVQLDLTGPDRAHTLRVGKVLVAIGAKPDSEAVWAGGFSLADTRGFIATDGRHETAMSGVWAIGDVTGPLMLAHVASHQAVRAVEAMAGRMLPPLDYAMMPRATYSHPEVASMGLTETQARATGRSIAVGTFPFQANGRALAMGDPTGFAKVVADEATGELLGAHFVGANVSELLGEPMLGVASESTLEVIDQTVHPHPTLSEAFKEAALAALGRPIHLPARRGAARSA